MVECAGKLALKSMWLWKESASTVQKCARTASMRKFAKVPGSILMEKKSLSCTKEHVNKKKGNGRGNFFLQKGCAMTQAGLASAPSRKSDRFLS